MELLVPTGKYLKGRGLMIGIARLMILQQEVERLLGLPLLTEYLLQRLWVSYKASFQLLHRLSTLPLP